MCSSDLSTIWTYQTGGYSVEPVLISNGIIYTSVYASTQNTMRLLALDATTRALKWSQDQVFGSGGGQASTSNPAQPLVSDITTRQAIGSQDQDFGSGRTQVSTNNPVRPLITAATDYPLGGGGSGLNAPITFSLDTTAGLIYVLINNHTVNALHADTGTLVTNYTFNSSVISAFVLVTQNN